MEQNGAFFIRKNRIYFKLTIRSIIFLNIIQYTHPTSSLLKFNLLIVVIIFWCPEILHHWTSARLWFELDLLDLQWPGWPGPGCKVPTHPRHWQAELNWGWSLMGEQVVMLDGNVPNQLKSIFGTLLHFCFSFRAVLHLKPLNWLCDWHFSHAGC